MRVPTLNLATEDLSGDNVLHIMAQTKTYADLIFKLILTPEHGTKIVFPYLGVRLNISLKVNAKVIRDLLQAKNIDGQTPIEVAFKDINEASRKEILAKVRLLFTDYSFFRHSQCYSTEILWARLKREFPFLNTLNCTLLPFVRIDISFLGNHSDSNRLI